MVLFLSLRSHDICHPLFTSILGGKVTLDNLTGFRPMTAQHSRVLQYPVRPLGGAPRRGYGCYVRRRQLPDQKPRRLPLPWDKMGGRKALTLTSSTLCSLRVESRRSEHSQDRSIDRNCATQKAMVVWRRTMTTPGAPSTHQQAHIP